MATHAIIPDKTAGSEAQVRKDLAACYRLAAHYGWDDLVATHISARVPGEDTFLINPFGMMFEEITPANLIKVDMDGEIVGQSDWGVNKAGFVVHSAVHGARHDAACVIHLHTVDGVAVSMAEDGLLYWNQNAMMFANDVAMHDFEGVADRLDERERLVADLGADKTVMLLRNHGTLALGRSVAEAFTTMFYFEKACQTQVAALSMGLKLRQVGDKTVQSVAAYRAGGGFPVSEPLVWPAMLRMLDRLYPGWKG